MTYIPPPTQIPGRGCPICFYDYSTWTLLAQMAHVEMDHTWWQRMRLWWRTRRRLHTVIIRRNIGIPL